MKTTNVAKNRPIRARTRGRAQGEITRLVSPSDLGELIKPFVFLDLFAARPTNFPRFGWHPHSGIATLTLLLEGENAYEETTGVKGTLSAGGVEWMRAGGGVWHTGKMLGDAPVRGYQLWVALPPQLENAVPESRYLTAADIPSEGPVRVILGSYGSASSSISAPADMNYLDIRLRAGERWTYRPPAGHTVAWLAVHEGRLDLPGLEPGDEGIAAGELVVFDDSAAAIILEAPVDTGFVLGSAARHPHALVLGNYSVHTHRDALNRGEAEIERIGKRLRATGIAV